MSYFCCFTLVPWQLWLYGDYQARCRLPVGLMKLLVETQLTCGPNEAPGRNKVVWFFTCGPNEAPGRNQVVWGLLPVGLTKLLIETKLCGLLLVGLTKLLVEALSCGLGSLWFYAFEKYWKIIWLIWCII